MSNKTNTEEIKNQSVNEEQKQDQNPVAEPKAAEVQQPAEQKNEEFKRVLFWEVRKAPKKEKESKDNTQKPKKDGKWGLGKAVAVTTMAVTATGAVVKVASMVLDKVYGNGDCNYQYENNEPSYQQQAIEGQYQDVPASENTEASEG